jgi:hypothetical protein
MPARQGQRYIHSCWYKTGPNFQANAQTGWTVAVTAGGTPIGDAIVVPFVDTQTTWPYLTQAVDLASYQPLKPGATLSIGLTAANTSATVVLLDDNGDTTIPSIGNWRRKARPSRFVR